MDEQNIILTGFMGTGKSTVGRILAAELGYAFVDTDQLIAQRAGKPVSLIFTEDGEPVFRDWESQITVELAREKRLVVATGGGLMVSERNTEALQKHGRVFCLVASPKEILARVKKSGRRPLLDDPNPKARIEELLAEREGVYSHFSQIKTSRKSPEKVAKEILKQITAEQKTAETELAEELA